MTAAQQLAADLAAIAEVPAESILYSPTGGTARTIRAAVTREGAQPLMGATAPGLRVTVANDSTLGIVPSSLNIGRDTISIAERIGGTAVARQIKRIVSQSAVHVELEIQ